MAGIGIAGRKQRGQVHV